MADDLTAIPGLEERHRRALAMRLGITTYSALAHADPHEVYSAMSRNRPRPTLDEITEWQDEARHWLVREAPESPPWVRAASFVIVFEQRRSGSTIEQRLMAEQTELEPEQPPASWPSWDIGGLDDWLEDRLSAAEPTWEGQAPKAEAAKAEEPATEAPAPETPEPEALEPETPEPEALEPETPEPEALEAEIPEPAGAPPPGSGPELVPRLAELLFDSVAMVDAGGRLEAVADGQPTGLDLAGTLPARLHVRVTGARPGSDLRIALRFREPGRPQWSPQAPVSIRSNGVADLELSEATIGRHYARVVAWAPDGSAEPAGVDLGDLTILPPVPPAAADLH